MRNDLLFLVLHGVILNPEHNQAQTQNLANLPILELQCSQPQITKHNINPVRDLWRENSFTARIFLQLINSSQPVKRR